MDRAYLIRSRGQTVVDGAQKAIIHISSPDDFRCVAMCGGDGSNRFGLDRIGISHRPYDDYADGSDSSWESKCHKMMAS